ncbi:MAG: serine protease [Pseudomonadota bacterium]
MREASVWGSTFQLALAALVLSWLVEPAAGQVHGSAIERVTTSVVRIKVTGTSSNNLGTINNFGTGFFIAEAGEILTARHVVALKDGREIEWARDNQGRFRRRIEVESLDENGVFGERQLAALGPTDSTHDAAVLRIPATGMTPVTCSMRSVAIGEEVIAIGYRRGRDNYDLMRGARLDNREPDRIFSWRFDDRARRGNSGGPVFDGEGRVVAMIVATEADGSDSFFATPLAEIANLLPPNTDCADEEPSIDLVKACVADAIQAARADVRTLTDTKQARSEGGGVTGRAHYDEQTARIKALPGFEIIADTVKKERVGENDAGAKGEGDFVFERDGDHVVAVTLLIWSQSPARPFGPGTWNRVELSGQQQPVVDDRFIDGARETCRKGLGLAQD